MSLAIGWHATLARVLAANVEITGHCQCCTKLTIAFTA
jgi:hypothetical protein